MSRYGNNVRRIAQTDELTKRILQAEQKLNVLEKSPITGSRAIAYPNGVQTGSPGKTNPDKDGAPDDLNPLNKNAMDDAGKDDTSTDGDDILNGTKVLRKGEDPGAIELKDCESGEPIDIRFNTASNSGESKFKHPDGWDINGPHGVKPGWENFVLGTYYHGSGTYFTNEDSPTAELLPYNSIGYVDGTFGYIVTQVRNIVITGTSTGTYEAYLDWSSTSFPINTGWGTYGFTFSSVACGAESGTDRCPISAPPAYANWQEQDPAFKHQLAFSAEDGGFVSSEWDDGLPTKFRNDVGNGKGLNNLNLCTLSGNEVTVSALRDGTFAFFEQDGFGAPQDDAKIFHFDSEGKYLDTIRPDQYSDLSTLNNPLL